MSTEDPPPQRETPDPLGSWTPAPRKPPSRDPLDGAENAVTGVFAVLVGAVVLAGLAVGTCALL